MLRLYQCQKQTNERRFASTRLTHHCSTGARFEVNRKVPKCRLLTWSTIIESDLFESNATRSRQHAGLTLLFLRNILQLHQALCSSKDTHEGRHQFCQVTGRSLNTVYQLQESRHATKSQCASIQTESAPKESHQESNRKTQVQKEVASHREGRAFTHPLAQRLLGIVQSLQHLPVGLHRLHQHTMLHGLCQQTLNQAVRITYPSVVPAHISDVDTAHQDKDGQDSHRCDGQPRIHLKKIDESTHKHGQRTKRRRERLCEESDHRLHILFQTVDDITTMHRLASSPLRTKQPC